jgi:predicted  nucleic acid-binding Zn-ribbon protein
MSVQDFSSLVQAQSLDIKVHDHLQNIESHKNRITHINKQREIKKTELLRLETVQNELKSSISKNEKELFKIESELDKAKSHLADATSQQQVDALEKEISTLSPRAENLEENILEELDKQESNLSEQEICKKFLDGSVETIAEVEVEVTKDCDIEYKEIEKYQERIDLLLENCPENYKSLYINLNKKYKYNSPVSFVSNSHCNSCKLAITGVQKSTIEAGNSIELCAGCGRILAPLGAINA